MDRIKVKDSHTIPLHGNMRIEVGLSAGWNQRALISLLKRANYDHRGSRAVFDGRISARKIGVRTPSHIIRIGT
jgi:hypothetical protein